MPANRKVRRPKAPGDSLQTWERRRAWANPGDLTRLIVESSGDGIISVNPEGKIEAFNPAMEQLTGFSTKRAIGRVCRELLKPQDETGADLDLCDLAEAGQNPLKPTYTVTIRTKTGRRWVGVSAAVREGSRGDHVIAVLRDISHQYEAQKRQLEFISIASHELRTPITALSGYLSLAQQELRESPATGDRLDRFVNRAYDASIRLTELVEDLLNVVRLEEGRLVFRLMVMSPQEPLLEIVNAMRPAITGKQLSLEVDDRLKPSDLIRADRSRIDQILANLLDNAIKYTAEEGSLKITARATPKWITIAIADTGIGIHPENLDRIYEKFFREYTDFSVTAGGTGLGLFITKELVERQGGVLTITSEQNKGTVATVKFPKVAGEHKKNVH